MKRLTDKMSSSKDEEFEKLVKAISGLGLGGKQISEGAKKILYNHFDRLPNRKEWDKDVFSYLLECDIWDSFP